MDNNVLLPAPGPASPSLVWGVVYSGHGVSHPASRCMPRDRGLILVFWKHVFAAYRLTSLAQNDAGRHPTPASRTLWLLGNSASPTSALTPLEVSLFSLCLCRAWFNYLTCSTSLHHQFIDSFLNLCTNWLGFLLAFVVFACIRTWQFCVFFGLLL